ncbi:n-ethylmaleimide reductase-like protein [Leptomonas seymouri]|uniref:N-ethylmaleimide reductase-like protein n=1 Tax=Leptomonas seymouri TaxID=5684 RepID=A0A0N1HZB3_LEPSE|nr:n-ethylmaleimide reductase-like protein [Leptomonas seymouri]|eukprot:KPI82660.1 n-ethylmaleimide reductase-like protein [Leptomonas seymouri]
MSVCSAERTGRLSRRGTVVAPAKDRPFYAISQPLLIGNIFMKNRLVMGPIARQRCDANHCPMPMMVDYYARRAGYGLQVSDPCEVQPGYYTYVQGAAITTKAQVEAWRRVTDAVHQAGGVLFCQLHHGGRAMVPCNITCADKRVVGPTTQGILSRYTCPAMFSADGTSQPYAQEVSELSPSALAWIVKLFAASAKNAVLAGFDGVEIHAGGGYLIDQFLQQSSNTRTDDYGGSPDRRCRLLDEVVDAVVAVVGRYRVGVRLSPTELSKGMIALEAETLARVAGAHLRDRKVAYVVLSSGSDGFFHGPVPIRIIQALRQNFSGVVMCDDNISVAEAEQRVKEDIVQGVCMTLGAIANPDMMERAIHGVAMEVTDLLTLSTHGAEGYDTYTSYAELRRQLREEQSREWSENEANCPIGRESWLSERRVSAMRQDLKSTRTSQVFTSTPLFQPLTPVTSCTTTSAKAAGAAGGGGASSTSLCSHRRDRRYSSISSLGFRNSSIHFNGSDDVASVNTPNAASGRAALPLKPSRAGSSLYGQRSASGLNESASICVRRDSRANRRQTIG